MPNKITEAQLKELNSKKSENDLVFKVNLVLIKFSHLPGPSEIGKKEEEISEGDTH